MRTPLRVLLVEDSEDDADLLLWEIRGGGYDVIAARVDTEEAMRAALEREWDVVVSDYSLPQFSGLAALELVQHRRLDVPFLLVSGNIGEDVAVAAMKAGAHDYVMKRSLSRLVPAIERELREAAERKARRGAERGLRDNEARLRAIVSNLPGVVFQLQLREAGDYRFSYASEGSYALLGMHPQDLLDSADRFFAIILPADREALWNCIAASAAGLTAANWEGRITVAGNQNAKWINLRFSPRALEGGSIQWEGFMANITQSKLAEEEIRRSQQRLSELSSHLEKIKEEERTRIAREIHDDIGGNLTAIKIDLLWLESRLGKGRKPVLEKLRAVESLVDQTMETASRIGRDLRPGILDLGILAAIEWQAREFEKRMDTPCRVECDAEDFAIDPELASALFSTFRETLTNISKHAHACEVRVKLRLAPDYVELVVTDDGRGIESHDLWKPGSFGLRGMQERAAQLGGSVSICGAPGHGTSVTVRLPHRAGAQAAEAQAITAGQA